MLNMIRMELYRMVQNKKFVCDMAGSGGGNFIYYRAVSG
jgi:hypothetical protein